MRERTYKAVVVDDEPVCIDNLKKSLVAYPEVLLVGESRTAAEGSLFILNEQPDLLFLDVELPDMSGVELLQGLQHRISWNMRVVFYTSHQKYWLEALRRSAFDYLLKPYLPGEFALMMDRFMETVRLVEHTEFVEPVKNFEHALSELLPSQQTFVVPNITGYLVIRVHQVGFFAYLQDKRQWFAALTDGKQVALGRNIKSDQLLAFSPSFVPINRHQIINRNYLFSIMGNKCCLIHPFDEVADLHISRNYHANLLKKLRLISAF